MKDSNDYELTEPPPDWVPPQEAVKTLHDPNAVVSPGDETNG